MNARTLSLTTAVTLAAVIAAAFVSMASTDATAKQTQASTAHASPSARSPQRGPLLDPNDTVILLLDHQSGLFQTVNDISITELRTNTIVLSKLAELANLPIITTASEPNGPNGPLMPEIAQHAPSAIYVPRKGEISAWDNEDFVNAVEATGRKTLIIAGVWTSVCVAFPALQAQADGYNVYFVTDASGDPSVMASQTTIARMSQAGIIPMSTNAVFCEIQRTWNRSDAAEYAELYAMYAPAYQAVMESHQRAQNAAANHQ